MPEITKTTKAIGIFSAFMNLQGNAKLLMSVMCVWRFNHERSTRSPARHRAKLILVATRSLLQVIMELAREVNKRPLNEVPQKPGVLLPPEKYCLTALNYHVLSATELEETE